MEVIFYFLIGLRVLAWLVEKYGFDFGEIVDGPPILVVLFCWPVILVIEGVKALVLAWTDE